jgi:hypothetical protein
MNAVKNAMNIPVAPSMFPLGAVFGFERFLMPIMKKMALRR